MTSLSNGTNHPPTTAPPDDDPTPDPKPPANSNPANASAKSAPPSTTANKPNYRDPHMKTCKRCGATGINTTVGEVSQRQLICPNGHGTCKGTRKSPQSQHL